MVNFDVNRIENVPLDEFISIMISILEDFNPPEKNIFLDITKRVNYILDNEKETFRPYDNVPLPGGVIKLDKYDKVLIMPDLHARRDFFKKVLVYNIDGHRVIDLLENESFSILCLGDGVHSEGELADRWRAANVEFLNGYKKHDIIDREISDSFNLMIAVMLLKIRYKDKFNFLKGNHENIMNETGNGNYSFAKFSNEGAMVNEYFKRFYGADLLKAYYNFEKKLPVFVIGRNFIASHSEPEDYYDLNDIINYRNNAALIEGFTWTDNNKSPPGTIKTYINKIFPGKDDSQIYYFGGHRPIKGFYNRINGDNFIQIHNPYKYIVALINSDRPIELDNDIFEIDNTDFSEDFTVNNDINEIDFSENI